MEWALCEAHLEYTPLIMHTVLFCFVLLWLYYQPIAVYRIYLPIPCRIASLKMGQSYDGH